MNKIIEMFKNFIERIKNIKQIFKFNLKKSEVVEYKNSKFQKYLENIDILDPSYDAIKEAIELCQQSIYFYERKNILTNRLQEFILQEKDLEIFNAFEKSDIQKLQNYIDTYKKVSKETGSLKNQLNRYDKTLEYLSKFESEIEAAIKEIEYSENKQTSLKRDMAYINGEKEELIYSKEQLEQGLDFLYKFSIVLVCILAIITFTLAVLKTAYSFEIFIPLTVLVVLTIILGSAIYIFQRKFKYELKRNALLQVRAVELLNRTKALYINCTGFLNYEYKKYRVRNSEMLKNNWDEYLYQKQISRRHIAMNNRMQELIDTITQLLIDKGIQNASRLFEELLNLISLEDKRVLYRDIKNERINIQNELEELDIKQEKLWGQIMELQRKDTTEDNIISQVIESYENELNSIKSEGKVDELDE